MWNHRRLIHRDSSRKRFSKALFVEKPLLMRSRAANPLAGWNFPLGADRKQQGIKGNSDSTLDDGGQVQKCGEGECTPVR